MKKVALTDQIASALKNGVKDPSFDTSRIDVFEASFVTSRPLEAGGIYRGARITKTGLDEMAAFLSGEGNAIPIHVEHNLGRGSTKDYLPVGKAFAASVVRADDGEYELRGYFYIDKGEHPDLVNKIESSTVSEMSIQAGWTRAISNKSGFNFFEPGNEAYAWERVDNEGNRLGEDGHHALVSGLGKFHEISLVGRGASPGARIHAQRTFNLAASSAHEAISTLTTLVSDVVEDKAVDTAALSALTTQVEGLKAEKTTLTASIADLQGQVTKLAADLKAAQDAEPGKIAAAVEAANAASAAASESVRTLLLDHAKAAAVAANLQLKDDATIEELSTLIKDAAVKLHTIIPVGGVSKALDEKQSNPNGKPALSAFRVRS